MASTDAAFTGSIPRIYDRRLGPLLFAPYAQDLADRLAGFEGDLLELAAGTGILTAELARAAPGARLTSSDLNPAMLELASRKAGVEQVTWRTADAQSLPFEAGAFDLVVCQFGVMFFPDKVGAFSEARRVLRPGGRLLFSVWDRLEDNEASLVVTDAVAAAFPHDPPSFVRRIPHGWFAREVIRGTLGSAGFAQAEIETVTLRGRAPSAEDPAIGLCQGTPMRSEIEARDPQALEGVTQAAVEAVAARFGPGPIDTKLQALIIEARA